MNSKDNLKYNSINHGVVSYNRGAIENVRAKSSGNKAHIKRKSPLKKFVTNVKIFGFVMLVVVPAVSGVVLAVGYRGEMDNINSSTKYEYVDKLGSIMNNYSETDFLKVADDTIEAIKKQKGPEEDLLYIQESIPRIEYLRSQGMTEEMALRYKTILAIASKYGVFLPGQDYSMPTFFEYIEDTFGNKGQKIN